jgi:NDP-mannose synthase
MRNVALSPRMETSYFAKIILYERWMGSSYQEGVEHSRNTAEGVWNPIMMAVILAGGKGTRLKPFTMTIPKPLLPLGDIPILEVVLAQLAAAQCSRVVLTLGHMSHLFRALLGDGTKLGLRLEYCFEDEPLGTAGSLRLINDLEDDFLVMNGDLLTTLDYAALIREHRKRMAWGTIALHERTVGIDYGVVKTSEDGYLVEYIEKPTIPYDVSMGINVLSRRCVEYIPAARRFDMPDLMLAMRRAGKTVIGYKSDCYWQDIGRFEDYQQASADFVASPSRFLPGKTNP